MSTDITGGNTQIGTMNRQIIKSIETNNSNNITINISVVNCTNCHQHQHQESVSGSGGDVKQLIKSVKSIASTCGQTTQPRSEPAITSKCEPTTQVQPKVVEVSGSDEQANKSSAISTPAVQDCVGILDSKSSAISTPDVQDSVRILDSKSSAISTPAVQDCVGILDSKSSAISTPAVQDSVTILDSRGRMLEPGDGVRIGSNVSGVLYLYIGDGYLVGFDKASKTIVKEMMDMRCPFKRHTPHTNGNLQFSPELRVQRALQHIGRPCPVPGGDSLDFVYWIFTGRSFNQLPPFDQQPLRSCFTSGHADSVQVNPKMEPDFIGGINQVGTSNLQVINNITVNVNININGKTSHLQQKKVSNQGEHLHHFLDSLQKLVKSFGHTTQITTQSQSELVINSQRDPTTQAKDEEIRNKAVKKVSRLGQLGKAFWPKSATQTRSDVSDQIDPSPQMDAVAADSVTIVDTKDQVLEPGDAVLLKICTCGVLSLYVGDGFVVRYDEDSMTVVKEKFDMTRPFRKWIIRSEGNLNVYSWEWRVHRALQRVGRPCPVQFGEGVDFVLWTFTGLSCEQSIQRGFYLDF